MLGVGLSFHLSHLLGDLLLIPDAPHCVWRKREITETNPGMISRTYRSTVRGTGNKVRGLETYQHARGSHHSTFHWSANSEKAIFLIVNVCYMYLCLFQSTPLAGLTLVRNSCPVIILLVVKKKQIRQRMFTPVWWETEQSSEYLKMSNFSTLTRGDSSYWQPECNMVHCAFMPALC